MAGNLDGWKPKIEKAKTWWELIKKYYIIATVILASVGYGVNEGYKYYLEEIKNTPVVQNTIKSDNKILSSSFSDNTLTAEFTELIIPNQTVDVYKLVKISTTKIGSFYDLLVMTVQNGQLEFVDALELKQGGWCFTGKPGQYSIRLSVFDPNTGFSASTGQVIIGNAPQPPPVKLPTIDFTASSTNIKVGESVTLSWTTTDANSVTLNNNTVAINGTQVFSPLAGTHTFTLVAVGNGGSSNKTVTVNVSNNPLPPPPSDKYGFGPAMHEVIKTKIPKEYISYAAGLADNFEGVASGVAAGSWKTPNEMNTELAGRNRLTLKNDQTIINAWMPFFQAWTERTSALNREGKLPNLADEYRIVYLETVTALRSNLTAQSNTFESALERDYIVYQNYLKATGRKND